MQNDTSNTNLKMTKMDNADANPTKAGIAASVPASGPPVLLPGQTQAGQRQPQILMPGHGNINKNVAQLITQFNKTASRSDPAIFNHPYHINYKTADAAQNLRPAGAAGLLTGTRPCSSEQKDTSKSDGPAYFTQLASQVSELGERLDKH